LPQTLECLDEVIADLVHLPEPPLDLVETIFEITTTLTETRDAEVVTAATNEKDRFHLDEMSDTRLDMVEDLPSVGEQTAILK